MPLFPMLAVFSKSQTCLVLSLSQHLFKYVRNLRFRSSSREDDFTSLLSFQFNDGGSEGICNLRKGTQPLTLFLTQKLAHPGIYNERVHGNGFREKDYCLQERPVC